jgi:hypothetical protein
VNAAKARRTDRVLIERALLFAGRFHFFIDFCLCFLHFLPHKCLYYLNTSSLPCFRTPLCHRGLREIKLARQLVCEFACKSIYQPARQWANEPTMWSNKHTVEDTERLQKTSGIRCSIDQFTRHEPNPLNDDLPAAGLFPAGGLSQSVVVKTSGITFVRLHDMIDDPVLKEARNFKSEDELIVVEPFFYAEYFFREMLMLFYVQIGIYVIELNHVLFFGREVVFGIVDQRIQQGTEGPLLFIFDRFKKNIYHPNKLFMLFVDLRYIYT